MESSQDLSALKTQLKQLEVQLEKSELEKNEISLRAKKASAELTNMMKAQGNLYRFQEKVERQRTIYAQIAEVGHQFNSSLDFGKILEAVHRFIVDHLNFEKCVLLLPDANKEAPFALQFYSQAGYNTPQEKQAISRLRLVQGDPIVSFFSNPVNKKILFSSSSKTNFVREDIFSTMSQALCLDEWVMYTLGLDSQKLPLGLIVMGNKKEHYVHHLRVVEDPENDALFSNITGQIAGAQNTIRFLQAIQSESTQVKRLLNNMRQAVFTVDPQFRVTDPVSLFTQSIFAQDLVGRNILETVYKDIDSSSEEFASLKTVLTTVFGENELQWQLVEDQLPKKFVFKSSDGVDKSLKVNYAPIWNDSDELEKLMFVVEDTTEFEKLEKQVSAERARIQVIQEIAGNDILNLNKNFFDRAWVLYSRCKDLVPTFRRGGEHVIELMRNLHTLKGNARMHGFTGVSRQVHHCEAKVLELKKNLLPGKADPRTIELAVAGELDKVLESLKSYGAIAQKVFGVQSKFVSSEKVSADDSVIQMVEIHDDSLRTLEAAIQNVPAHAPGVDGVRKALFHLRDMPLKPTLQKFEPMVREVSETLGKKVDLRILVGENVKMGRGKLEEIQDSLVHLIRNALDHGIEKPDERLRAGKSETGSLVLRSLLAEGCTVLSVEDDGRGIDPDKLAALAVQKGILSEKQVLAMSPQEKLSIVFISGFSSKGEATELSGRGVGMDMVKQTLTKLGAHLRIDSQIGKGSQFIIEFPE